MDPNDTGLLGVLAKRFAELQAAFRTLSKQAGPKGDPGKDGADGAEGPIGPAGADGAEGAAGKDGKKGPKGDKGATGPIGPMPKHKWEGTKLRFEKPDGDWGKPVDLKGEPGAAGGGNVAPLFSSGFNPSALDAATDTVPEEFIVRQSGTWVRATYEQMATWLGGAGPGVPDGAVTVGGSTVTVDGDTVTVT